MRVRATGPIRFDRPCTCAQRLGHGTRLLEDPGLEDYVAEQRIPTEVCLSSNVHTRVVDSIGHHPVRRYFDKGCVVTLTDEYWLAHTECNFSRGEIDRLILNAFESAFLPDQEKAAMVARIGEELQDIT
jgi:adenosine deaminase